MKTEVKKDVEMVTFGELHEKWMACVCFLARVIQRNKRMNGKKEKKYCDFELTLSI